MIERQDGNNENKNLLAEVAGAIRATGMLPAAAASAARDCRRRGLTVTPALQLLESYQRQLGHAQARHGRGPRSRASVPMSINRMRQRLALLG